MNTDRIRRTVENLLARAGVTVGGTRPFDPQVHDERFFARVLAEGSLGFGDSYVDGWWDCDAVDQLVHRLKRARLDRAVQRRPSLATMLRAQWVALRARARAFRIGEAHYDRGNDLFAAMLDRRLIYTGAVWDGAPDLDEAQRAKLDLVARKLHLEPGMRVLDIGCGWGGTARHLAENHGVSVLGITVSREQCEYAQRLCEGLPVEIRMQDYRDLDGRFDRIVSLGMIEHVGARHYRHYFDVVRRRLAPEGLFVLQTIGSSARAVGSDPWIEKHIFPESALPTTRALADAFEDRMVLEHWQNLGPHYDRTLMAWHENFEGAWPRLRERYDERFRRLWRFYLLSCAGAFRARSIQLWQMVFSPEGVEGGYAPWPADAVAERTAEAVAERTADADRPVHDARVGTA